MNKLKKGLGHITDAGFGIMIFAVACAFLYPLINSFIQDQKMSVAAAHAQKVEFAVNKYITDNYATIAASSSPGTAYTITVPTLINAGYLPNGFSPTNNYASTYQTKIYQPVTNKFHTMTFLTGGVQLKLAQARKLAIMIGATGGYIEAGIAHGAQGAWSENLSSFGGFNPGDGHIVIAGFYANGAVANDYLYRKAVPGRPELNTMSTALNMGGNDVASVRNLNASGAVTAGSASVSGNASVNGTLTTSNAVVNGTVTAGTANVNGNATVNGTVNAGTVRSAGETYTGGWFRTTGDTGWYSEKWGGGFHMTDSTWIRAYGGKSIYTSGQLQGGTVRSEGRLSTGDVLQLDQINTAGTSCPQNGLVSRDVSGGLLTCQNRVWTKPSSGKPGYYCRYTSMSAHKSEDYIGYTPRTDRNCPVISPGQMQGECACMKIILDY